MPPHPEPSLDRSVLLALWAATATSGAVGAVEGEDEPHEVLGLDTGSTLADLVSAWRRQPGEIVALLPVPGDLAAPAEVAALAAECEECVLLRTSVATWVAVPEVNHFGPEGDLGTAVTWSVTAVEQVRPLAGMVGTLAEAEQELREVLRRSVDELVDLDLARWRPEAAAALADLRRGRARPAPPRSRAATGPGADRRPADARGRGPGDGRRRRSRHVMAGGPSHRGAPWPGPRGTSCRRRRDARSDRLTRTAARPAPSG